MISNQEEEDDDDENKEEDAIENLDNEMDITQFEENPVNHHGFDLWECTDERCILQFRRRSDRDSHMDTGKHKYESNKITLVEKAKYLFRDNLENDKMQKNIPLQNFNISQPLVSNQSNTSLPEGWALPTQKPPKRFNDNQRTYMTDAYDRGEQTGFKTNPATLALVS